MKEGNIGFLWIFSGLLFLLILLQEVNMINREHALSVKTARIERESEEKYQSLLKFMNYYRQKLESNKCCQDQNNVLPN